MSNKEKIMNEVIPMMKCGHRANGYDSENRHICVLCINKFGYNEVDNSVTDFSKRIAKCEYCSIQRPSSEVLAFFEYKKDNDFDSFYCGCRGWG